MPSFSCVDLFCGAGGLSLGVLQKGIHVSMGVDRDQRYKTTYNQVAPFHARNIKALSSGEVSQWLKGGSVRVLAGCPPCQPYSSYSLGRYRPEVDLFAKFTRLAVEVSPDVIVLENVVGVLESPSFAFFQEVLSREGYVAQTNVVECWRYGVPQTRKRVVVLAGKGAAVPLTPGEFSSPVTVREVIGDLPPLEAGGADKKDPLHRSARLIPRNLARIRASSPGGTWRDWPKYLLPQCYREKSGASFPSVYGRMSWDQLAPTITTQSYGYGSGRFGHPEQDRALSLREAALLQGFPRDYKFPLGFRVAGTLIGNAVPVPLARAIAKSIVNHFT